MGASKTNIIELSFVEVSCLTDQITLYASTGREHNTYFA